VDAGLVRGTLAIAICQVMLTGCQSPIPFHAAPDPDAPVLGFGGSAPYVSLGPPSPPAAWPPAAEPRPGPPSIASRTAGRSPDVYAYTRRGMLSPAVRGIPGRVYVANSDGSTIDVINPRTYRVIGHVRVGAQPHYVIPSWDLRTLWVNDSGGDDLVPIDPRTGRRGPAVPVTAPYNLQFTPNGRYALVMVNRPARIDVRDPRSMRLRRSIPLPCGIAHADFSADGSYLVAGCAATGYVIRVDLRRGKVTRAVRLGRRAMPQDVKIAPDGTLFYVADMANGGVWTIDAVRFRPMGFVRTGRGAHGLIPSRDATVLYVTNRAEGTISLLDFATRQVVGRWRLPGGGSPDMGGVSADGRVLWLSGRRQGVVYAISTRSGRLGRGPVVRAGELIRAIRVGRSPHGVCVFPQPGRHSLGHTYR
jgi:YVTN family beta-propeller protein